MKPNALYIRALLGVVAFTALVIALFGRKPSGGSDTWLPSSFNAASRGHRALYTTLEELHWPVSRWQGSMRELTGTGQTLLLARNALSHRYPLQPLEIDQLLNWVARGNTLLLFGDFADSADAQPLFKQLGFRNLSPLTASDRLYEQSSEMLSSERATLTLHANAPGNRNQNIHIERVQPLPTPPTPSQVLLTDYALDYAVAVPHGSGRIVLVASASLLDNTFLPQGDNLPFVLNLLAPENKLPQTLWFEEAHHGYRTTFALTELWQQPGVRLAAAQIAVGLLVFLSSQVVRFGPVKPLQPRMPRSTLEFVYSLANLYRRADIRNDIVRSLYDDTHRVILHRFNLPPDTSHDLLAQRLKETFPQLPSWKKLAQRFDGTDYVQGLPPSGWLKVSRELIQIKNTLL